MKIYGRKRWLLWILIGFAQTVTAQNLIIQGKVIDAKNKKPLPFVNIIINEGQSGTTSDIDGKFYLEIQNIQIKSVAFSYIGYRPFRYEIREEADLKPLNRTMQIKLQEDRTLLPSITVKAGENPAHRIIKAAYQNRKRNDPAKIPSFAYRIYNKFFVNLEEDPLIEVDSVIAQTPTDSNRQQFAEYLKEHHLFMAESWTERKYIAPNFNKETVLANRVAGLKNPRFAAIATDIQPFSFYEDYVEILQKTYLNPISRGSTSNYFFAIEDTAFAQKDTVYIISFEPLPNRNFQGLEGRLYINTRDFAIQNVIASSRDRDELISFYIEQHYELFEDKYWFPTQLHANLTFNQLELLGKNFKGISRAYIDSVQVMPALRRIDFDEVTLEIGENSATRDEDFWKGVRNQSINTKEQKTYAYLDSLGRQTKLDRLMDVTEVLTYGRLPIKWVDLDLSRLLNGNRFEGLRIGLGAMTNYKLSERFSGGGYIAYGTKDNRIKYGLEAKVALQERFDVNFHLSYQDDVKEPGRLSLLNTEALPLLSSEGLREFLSLRMDRVERIRAAISLRPIRNTKLELGFQKRQLNPIYNYNFVQSNEEGIIDSLDSFRLSEFTAQVQYAFGQEFVKIGKRQIFVQSSYPVLSLNYVLGANWLNGDYTYHKWEAKIAHQITWTNIGTSTITMKGAWVNGDVPYSLLFNGLGITRRQPLIIEHHFQTMDLYEFLSDRFLSVFIKHNFGQLLFRPNARFSRPELVLVQGIGFGSLDNTEVHQEIDFQTMDLGFYESGFQINNLLRFNYLDIAYWGFGLGVYARYGAYARDKFLDNFSLKLTSHFTF